MHPAPSVIVFTTLSGLGFGLLFWLGLGLPAVTGWVAFFMFLIAYAMAVGGLLASTFHLGRPERAMKAFTQWRSSWLSREGCCAVGALAVMGALRVGRGIPWANMDTVGLDRRGIFIADGLHHFNDLHSAENHPALEYGPDSCDVLVL